MIFLLPLLFLVFILLLILKLLGGVILWLWVLLPLGFFVLGLVILFLGSLSRLFKRRS